MILILPLLTVSCLQRVPIVALNDTVISADTVWQGEIRVRGVITVKKGAQLLIRPGTRVVFEPLDRDNDGIGDGEILVEGGLKALGTARNPIVLTSGATEPRPKDWKYLYLDFAEQAEINYLLSEYAYSGIQVHFCKARVTNSEFRHNVDGVRFSTVNLELSGNLIHQNRHGIRYEERKGRGRVHHNQIVNNDIGVFAVTRCQGKTLFEFNNIQANRQYQVKLGIDQRQDLSFPRNWWGSSDPETMDLFFDKRYDRSVGRVSAPEPLAGPVPFSL